MQRPNEISPDDLIAALRSGRGVIDVRSEGEYAKGHLPRTRNIPILVDEHRHLVGCRFKERGQKAAIELGYELVAPSREDIIARWLAVEDSKDQQRIVMCWRGGLRSEIAAQWLRDAGASVGRVSGGYKAVRHRLMQNLEKNYPFVVIGGYTGSGKTILLHEFEESIDLEDLAAHRGSAFGSLHSKTQPMQQTFENKLAFELGCATRVGKAIPIEDESFLIGRVHIPNPLRPPLQQAPLVWLDSEIAARAGRIFDEYVGAEVTSEALEAHFLDCLGRIRRRLGGALYAELRQDMSVAFKSGAREHHEHWIQTLLSKYYDPRYTYGMKQSGRKPSFRGSYKECRSWIAEAIERS